MVGDWKASGPFGSMIITFNSDKTYTSKISMGNNTAPFISGKYDVNNKQVSMTADKVGANAVSVMLTGNDSGTLSDDGKTLTISGVSYTKQ